MINRRDFLKQSSILMAGSSFIDNSMHMAPIPGQLKYSSPESVGVSSRAILHYLQAVQNSGLEHHSFIMARRGKVITESYWKPFAADHIHTLFSLSKSFTSTAIGFAIQEARLKLSDKVISFFPDKIPVDLSENLKKMEVRHLLTMSTGHTRDTLGTMRGAPGVSWARTFFLLPVDKEPGTHFLYNTGATYMLSAILHRITNMPLNDYLKPRLFDPLGIKGNDWEVCPEGINVAGYGLRVSTRDIIRFGSLYLNNGKVNGNQILSADYIQDATRKHIDSTPTGGDWGEGYGYQFWRCKPGFYRGDGAHGQYCIVMPQHDAVIAINSESANMGKQMELIWEHILPGIKTDKLKKDKTAQNQLAELSSSLQLNAELGKSGSALVGKSIKLETNAWAWETLKINDGTLQLVGNGKSLDIPFGWNSWKSMNKRITNPFATDSRTRMPSEVFASAGSDLDGNLKLRLKYTDAMSGDLITFKNMADNKLEIVLTNSLVEKKINNQTESRKPIAGTFI